MFSKSCEYAIKIVAFVAYQQHKSTQLVGLEDISDAIDSPKAFTAKILQKLTKANLLNSTRGRSGGFYMNDQKEVVIADIIKAIDGPKLLEGCLLGFGKCQDENPCILHQQVKRERKQLKQKLSTTSIHKIAKRVNRKKAYFKE